MPICVSVLFHLKSPCITVSVIQFHQVIAHVLGPVKLMYSIFFLSTLDVVYCLQTEPAKSCCIRKSSNYPLMFYISILSCQQLSPVCSCFLTTCAAYAFPATRCYWLLVLLSCSKHPSSTCLVYTQYLQKHLLLCKWISQ